MVDIILWYVVYRFSCIVRWSIAVSQHHINENASFPAVSDYPLDNDFVVVGQFNFFIMIRIPSYTC